MSEPRIIKKYPNRRLYDTEESRYITLGDVRKLVVERIDFTVIDKASGDDITRNILLQVIAEQENQGEDPVLTREFLSQVIRSYGSQMQGVVSSYLEQSMRLFQNQQREIRERVKHVTGHDPVETVTSVAQKNYARWKSVQDDIFQTLSRVSGREEHRDEKPRDDDDAGKGT